MKATRYSEKKKQEVVKFVLDFDTKNGRGGKAAAARKFKINPITIATWMKKTGHGSSKVSAQAKPARQPKAKGPLAALKRMIAIQDRIAELQVEFDDLKATI